jgi:hypothetical protein
VKSALCRAGSAELFPALSTFLLADLMAEFGMTKNLRVLDRNVAVTEGFEKLVRGLKFEFFKKFGLIVLCNGQTYNVGERHDKM